MTQFTACRCCGRDSTNSNLVRFRFLAMIPHVVTYEPLCFECWSWAMVETKVPVGALIEHYGGS